MLFCMESVLMTAPINRGGGKINHIWCFRLRRIVTSLDARYHRYLSVVQIPTDPIDLNSGAYPLPRSDS